MAASVVKSLPRKLSIISQEEENNKEVCFDKKKGRKGKTKIRNENSKEFENDTLHIQGREG